MPTLRAALPEALRCDHVKFLIMLEPWQIRYTVALGVLETRPISSPNGGLVVRHCDVPTQLRALGEWMNQCLAHPRCARSAPKEGSRIVTFGVLVAPWASAEEIHQIIAQ